MYQKDYILRMLEMMGELIAAMLGLIKGGKLDKAQERLENTYHEVLREDASFFTKIPKEALTQTLLEKHHYTNDHLEILSELFYVQAELYYAKKELEKSLEFYEKALILLQFIMDESTTFSFEKESKCNLMAKKIAGLSTK